MADSAAQIAKPACTDKTRLLNEYANATAELSRSISVMQQRIKVLSRSEYQEIRNFAEQARVLADEARLRLENHIAEHGC